MARRQARKIRYRLNDVIDRSLIRGSLVSISVLTLGAVLVVFLGTVILGAWHVDLETQDRGILNTAWEVLLRALSPDQLANNTKWSARIVLLGITLFGLLLVSTLISILNSLISHRVESIHRGRSTVDLTDHLVLLNWSEFGPHVLFEIASTETLVRHRQRVAVLTTQSPIEIMESIRDHFRNIRTDSKHLQSNRFLRHPERWVTIRRGNTTSIDDLQSLSGIHLAAAVIILENNTDDSSFGPRVVLAVNEALSRNQITGTSSSMTDLPVVTFAANSELAHRLDRRLTEIAKLSSSTRRHINYIPISPQQIQHGIEVQVSRHRGLSAVYQDLVNFDDQEFYVVPGSRFDCTFGELLSNSRSSIPIALIGDGGLITWPDWSTPLASYQVIVLAQDQSSAESVPVRSGTRLLSKRGEGPQSDPGASEAFLFIGWTKAAEGLSRSLDAILPKHSTLTVLTRDGESPPSPSLFCETEIVVIHQSSSDPLDSPDFLDSFDHVVVFSNDSLSDEEADAEVLIDLLACRMHADQLTTRIRRFTIVAEVRREETRRIAGLRLADDLLVNDSLVASTAVQLATSPNLEPIFTALLSSEDPIEIVTLASPTRGLGLRQTWGDVLLSNAERTGEIAIGFRRDSEGDAVVTLNPPRETLISEDDEIFVLSLRQST